MADLRPTPCPAELGHRPGKPPVPCPGHVEWQQTRAWNLGQCNKCRRAYAYQPGRHPIPLEHRTGTGPIHTTRTTVEDQPA